MFKNRAFGLDGFGDGFPNEISKRPSRSPFFGFCHDTAHCSEEQERVCFSENGLRTAVSISKVRRCAKS